MPRRHHLSLNGCLRSPCGCAGELRGAGQQRAEFEARLQESTRDAEEAAAAAAKYEADLEALSSAYTDLEAHAHQLESRLGSPGAEPATDAVPATDEPGGTFFRQQSRVRTRGSCSAISDK